MEPRITVVEGTDIATVESDNVIIGNAQDALDLLATLGYVHQCRKAVLDKGSINEDFFELRTGLAGEVMQKFVNYNFAAAICGDFSRYTSKSLRDYIYECNQGRHLLFVADRQEAVDRLRAL